MAGLMIRGCWNRCGTFDFGEEFLVLVIEHVDGPKKQEVHFHRMNEIRLN